MKKVTHPTLGSSKHPRNVRKNLRPRNGTIFGTDFSFCQEILSKGAYWYAKHALAGLCGWILSKIIPLGTSLNSTQVGRSCTGQRTYCSKNGPIPSNEYAPYSSNDAFGIHLQLKPWYLGINFFFSTSTFGIGFWKKL